MRKRIALLAFSMLLISLGYAGPVKLGDIADFKLTGQTSAGGKILTTNYNPSHTTSLSPGGQGVYIAKAQNNENGVPSVAEPASLLLLATGLGLLAFSRRYL